ncbi:MAG: Stp1/IreP family PP2C-type Ser/Thr phosphatase [Planctomycetota bacterium]
MPFHWGCKSAAGKVRKENQDAYVADADSGLFIVSDGMGGQQAGELASKIVVSVLPGMMVTRLRELETADVQGVLANMRDIVLDVSKLLRGKSQEHTGLAGMGATIVVAWLSDAKAHIAHMGDSRAYLLREGRFQQLTKDHSVADLLLRMGEITPEEAEGHPDRSRLARYIGMPHEARPDAFALALAKGDRLLLCSDGLTGMVADEAITALLQKHTQPQAACDALVRAANAAGGQDNITVVLVDWTGGE